ncbi:MAG: cell division protein FtsL [Candidatus Cloacimonetes bacterium]|nr:cell division protein FtsL [Candidatus Cloacimonadota bacterium]
MEIQIRKQSHREQLRQRFLLNQRRITFAFIVSLSFVSSLGFLYLYQANQLVALVNRKEALIRERFALEKDRDAQMQEEVHLSSLQRIEYLARDRLGMIVPTREHRITITKP